MDLTWTFAPSSGGQEVGIHDPGVETFRGNFSHYLARELIQNSLDARLDSNKPVRVSLALEEVFVDEIPDLNGLRAAISGCMDYWHHQPKTVAILDRGLQAISGRLIRTLRFSDYNTRGIRGLDSDRKGDWYNLVRCAGSSAKSEGAGGSYGIGKNAPFAASLARTVLYSTKTTTGSVAFQGVARLASHQDSSGIVVQSTGFLGAAENAAVRLAGQIPTRFVRNETGSDIWIVGYPADDPSWKEDFIFSVLDDFWPAIKFDDLIVEVEETRISRADLEEKLLECSAKPEFTGHIYYQTFNEPQLFRSVEIAGLGECFIYLSVRDDDRPMRRVAMVRKTGMVITRRQFRSPLPFAGVFLCRNDAGNGRLREMEPPRHDDWSPDYPEKGASKKIRDAIGDALRSEIKKLLPAVEGVELSVPGLERFLPDINPDTGDARWNDSEASSEGSDGAVREPVEVRPVSSRKLPLPVFEEGAGAAGGLDSDEPGPQVGENTSDDDQTTVSDRTGESTSGEKDGARRAREVIPIRYRSFSIDSSLGKYIATIHPQRSCAAAVLTAYGVGEDQKSALPIIRARTTAGLDLPVKQGYIGPVALESGKTIKVEFTTLSGRYALEMTASEA